MENYEAALFYSDIFHIANDSLDNLVRDSRFKVIERKYNVAKKQETINEQKIKLKNYGMGLLATFGLMITTSLFFYNYRKQTLLKDRIIEQEAVARRIEIDNLKKENKIIAMQSMLEGQEDERKRIAQDLHDNIGTLMTSLKMKFLSIQKEIESTHSANTVQQIDQMINDASLEVRRISHQMTPQVLELVGLQGSIKELESQLTINNISVKSTLDALETIDDKKMVLHIYRIIQEVFNNIIKHSKADSISIFTEIRDQNLIIRLRDNGIGFNQGLFNDKKSLGLSGIISRIDYLNGTLKIIEDSGTHYKITIPIK